MAYSRWGDSDVYFYASKCSELGDKCNLFHCCSCHLLTDGCDEEIHGYVEAFRHLLDHVDAGHDLDMAAFGRLLEDWERSLFHLDE